ncbi:MAG: tRNA (adenosine(37)-N6)-threonylcarbamoyltransferase complex dimerization subunit type 1 TsaB [Spirochaetes bacterium]|nr:tRNA (adenosine(37)-N6)-threonylcarbamoyltransferase complex dimerization subunit type 1 TsaB [Spirochaetota bacterium]
MRLQGDFVLNILIIDTSCEHEIIIVDNGKTFGGAFMNTGFVHSLSLFERVDKVLAQSGCVMSDMDYIVCGVGPGSFTGVRIAVTTVRTISQLLNIPVVGIKSPLLYAIRSDIELNSSIMVGFDAKKSKVFGALYRKTEQGYLTLIEEGDYSPDYILDRVEPESNLICLGSGSVKYSEKIIEKLQKVRILDNLMPDINGVAVYCKDIAEKHSTKDYTALVPFYARLSDAEALKNNLVIK